MAGSREEMLRQLELGDLFEPGPTVAELEFLRRAAIPRIFDRPLAEAALRLDLPGAESVSFEKLVAASSIERVPESEGLFRMRDKERASQLQSFRTREFPGGTAEFLEISARVEEELRARGATWQIERLRHLLVVNPEQARAELEARWSSAEERFELTELEDLLDLLRERLIFADPKLSAMELRLAARLRGRGLWIDEWYRTSRMFERELIHTLAKGLLEGQPSAFLLHLYARGGMGKTMFVRWLLARSLRPARNSLREDRL
jgi:cellulose synthase operon protein C